MVVVADSGRIRDRRNLAAARECFESSTARTTRVSCGIGCFTTKTEQRAIDATCREMLPNKNPRMSLNPRDPMRMRSAFTRRACRTMVWARGPWAKVVLNLVRGPVAACPRATRADRSASRRRIPPAFSMAARARFSATGFLPLPALEGRWIDHMEKRHMLRLAAGERFECLYSPLRVFRPIHGTKNSHDRLPSSMTITANNQRATPGIRSALDVPVTGSALYVRRARILMVFGERAWCL